MNQRCHACGHPGWVTPVAELRAVLCATCDQAFTAWRDTHTYCVASDWPAWARLRRAVA